MPKGVIKAKIYRYNPDKDKKPYYQNYEVPVDRRVTVHELLGIIHRDIDGTLA
jgi:succinate dehydrogenase/fumarate reductase-like Fe-S protein